MLFRSTVLLEHFNRRTGQCDPGLERIASLLSISTRTVIRSNHKLERAGMFRKVRHGGYGNRNSYEPIWPRFAEYEVSWREKLKRGAKVRATRLSHSLGQACHIPADETVTQTYTNKNLHYETYAKGHPNQERGETSKLVTVAVKFGNRSADAARAQAERRWSDDLFQMFRATPITYGEVIQAITPELQSGATDIELKKRGAGVAHIVQQLKVG